MGEGRKEGRKEKGKKTKERRKGRKRKKGERKKGREMRDESCVGRVPDCMCSTVCGNLDPGGCFPCYLVFLPSALLLGGPTCYARLAVEHYSQLTGELVERGSAKRTCPYWAGGRRSRSSPTIVVVVAQESQGTEQ